MSGCVVRIAGVLCGNPGDMYVLGCVHEHMGKREICTKHAALMAGSCDCMQCKESRIPHECAIELRPIAYHGTVTPQVVSPANGTAHADSSHR